MQFVFTNWIPQRQTCFHSAEQQIFPKFSGIFSFFRAGKVTKKGTIFLRLIFVPLVFFLSDTRSIFYCESKHAIIGGRHGGSVVARLTSVLQSRVQIRHLTSSQLTANRLVGYHLRWHLDCG
jgi:hypothetical protein